VHPLLFTLLFFIADRLTDLPSLFWITVRRCDFSSLKVRGVAGCYELGWWSFLFGGCCSRIAVGVVQMHVAWQPLQNAGQYSNRYSLGCCNFYEWLWQRRVEDQHAGSSLSSQWMLRKLSCLISAFRRNVRSALFGIWRSVEWHFLPDNSWHLTGSIFKGQAVQEQSRTAWPFKTGRIGCPQT